MSQVITAHNSSGQAVLSSKVPEQQHELALPFGGMRLIYSSNSVLTNLNSEADIERYSQQRKKVSQTALYVPQATRLLRL